MDSKESIRKELDDLPFTISTATSICKACLALLNKRKSFRERLCELDKTITIVHETALNVIGIPLKLKGNTVRKLEFTPTSEKTLLPAKLCVKSTACSAEIGRLEHIEQPNTNTNRFV